MSVRNLIAVLLLFAPAVGVAQSDAEPAAEAELVAEAGAEAIQEATEATAPRLSRIQGRVALSRRRPVVGATVLAHREGDSTQLFLTSSSDTGAFKIDGLPDGEYRLRFGREGLEPLEKEAVTLRFPFRAVVEVLMKNQAVAESMMAASGGSEGDFAEVSLGGRVEELDGEGLGEVRMRFVRADGREDPKALRTSAEGLFDISLTPGDWRAEIEGVGLLRLTTLLRVEADTEMIVAMVRQPSTYQPTPSELMPEERPTAPADWN